MTTEAIVNTDTPGLDLAAYFNRIGHHGPAEPTTGTLRALVTAHTRTIAFENIDPLLGIPVIDLSAGALAEKLVNNGRGGYSYEHNGLMRYVLQALGYHVELLAGRVLWMRDDSAPLPARTHNVLSVTTPDTGLEYLVDVGFGGQTLSSPIRMVPGEIQPTRHEPYRIATHGDELLLEAQIRGVWMPLYTFSPVPAPQIDLEVGSWYVSTHPESIFVVGLTAARVTDDARWNLRGRNLAVHRLGGQSTRTRLESAAEVMTVLDEQFGIDISGLDGLEARITEVLDT